MATTRRDSRSAVVAAGVALALAGCAALSLAIGDVIGFIGPNAEAVFLLLWIGGWMLLAWATIVGVAVAVRLLRAVASRRRPALIETVLVVAAAVVIAGVMWTYPVFGSGGGVGVG